jgi:uncharacterized protein (TIGR02145 family)
MKLTINVMLIILSTLIGCKEENSVLSTSENTDLNSDTTVNTGEQNIFSPEIGSFIDQRDSKTYKTVKLGSQVWMAENLAYLPSISSMSENSKSSSHENDMYYYVLDFDYDIYNDQLNVDSLLIEAKKTDTYSKYGVLYNFNAITQNETLPNDEISYFQGVCPKGWRLPFKSDWDKLIDFALEQLNQKREWENMRELGKYFKSDFGWADNENGNNQTGFAGLPGESIDPYSEAPTDNKKNGYWWSVTTSNFGNNAQTYYLSSNSNEFYESIDFDDSANSVRCIQND